MKIQKIIPYKYIFGGKAISKIEGKCTFVEECLPMEEVLVEITQEKKDYNNAQIIEILKADDHRVHPFCPHYGECGGCNLQFADEAKQKELRMQILEESLLRSGLKDIPKIRYIGGNFKNYRNRFQFSYGGLKKRKENQIIQIKECPIADKNIQEFIKNELQNYNDIQRLQVYASDNIIGKKKLIITNTSKDYIKYDNSICTIKINDKNIKFDVKGFFQSNIEVLQKTLPILTKDLKGKNLIDIYCGVGTLSTFCAENFNTITLVEHNKYALQYAQDNIKNNCKNNVECFTYSVSGETFVNLINKNKIQVKEFDAAIIDPPRNGMEKSIKEYLKKTKIPDLRCLSCDPVTQSRDLFFLVEAGYKIEELYLLDFYPQTSHIESLAILKYIK